MKEVKNAADYQALINQDKPVLLDFYANWCGPCKALLPRIEQLATEYEGQVEIAKINVDNNRELALQYGVKSIPALFFVQNGEVKERLLGLKTKKVLENKIKNYLVPAA